MCSAVHDVVVVVVVAAAAQAPPRIQSHQSGASTFHVPWPQVVPFHTVLRPKVHLKKRQFKLFASVSGEILLKA